MTGARILACLRCNRGAALSEFVLIVPAMVLMLTGVVEVTSLLRLDRKLQNAAYATADLATQSPNLSDARLADIFTASDLVVQPFAAGGLAIGIVSVVYDPDDGVPAVDWNESLRGGTVPDATVTAAGLGPPGDSVVIVRATYQYVPIFGDYVFGTINLSETAIARPRRSAVVSRD